MGPPVRGREGVEERRDHGDRVGRTADHHAVADVQTPDPARHSDIEVAEAPRAVGRRAALRVVEVRVATVDEDVAGGRVLRELLERFIGDLSRGHHRPEDPR